MTNLNLNKAQTCICRCCDRKLWMLARLYMISTSSFVKYLTNLPPDKERLSKCRLGHFYSRYEIIMYMTYHPQVHVAGKEALYDNTNLSFLEMICDT